MSKQQQPELALVGGPTASANAPAPNPVQAPAPAPSPVQYFEAPATVDEVLVTILSWPRDHDSPAERAFAHWLRAYLEETLGQTLKHHAEGAFSVTIPREDGKPSAVLFSCHIDTVDDLVDSQIGCTKGLNYDANFGHIMLDDESAKKFGCLGADDGVGVWILLGMIAKGKPGTYLFHRGEECSGVSSKAIAKADKEWLKTFDLAVAFDRPNDYEVITHQGGARCASDKAARGLCSAFSEFGIIYKPSDRGVYTDTKEYRGLIPECFNLGVGYFSQHSNRETLDYAFASALFDAAVLVDWDTIPVDRTPEWSTYEPKYDWVGAWRAKGSGYYDDLYDEVDHDDPRNKWGSPGTGKTGGTKSTPPAPAAGPKNTPTTVSTKSLLAWVKTVGLAEIRNEVENYPDEAVDIIVGFIRENARLEAENETLANLVDDAIYNGGDIGYGDAH